MKLRLALLLAVLFGSEASAQQPVFLPCYFVTVTNCQRISAANPLPVTGTLTITDNSLGPIAPATATATQSTIIGSQYNSTQATFTNGQQGSLQISSRGALLVATGADTFTVTSAPSSSSSVGVAPNATQSAASNSVLKATPGNLYRATVTIGATSGWVMLFDATSLPGNGATGASMKYCVPVNSDGTKGFVDIAFNPPAVFATGITVGFSSTACNTVTASATAFFYGQQQ